MIVKRDSHDMGPTWDFKEKYIEKQKRSEVVTL